MKVHIVLGAGFGDEGKGNFTNYLCTQDKDRDKIVVRFSGGQQAGHTVIHNGLKHVFSNYGSGTLQGIPSYFSEHTCFYLNTMAVEKQVLLDKGITPILYIHPLARMTTPSDVAYGKAREEVLKHGSCGLGIGSTMSRHETTGYKVFAIDLLMNHSLLIEKLINIDKYYEAIAYRESLDFYKAYKYHLKNAEDAFFKVLRNWNINPLFKIEGYDFLIEYQNVIFEGSQGILLDKDHGVFPHVTYANTTSKNALEICDSIFPTTVQTYYVTRGYQTRHGNGWMSATAPVVLKNTEEEINVFNEWQGDFKTTSIDYALLEYAIKVNRTCKNSHYVDSDHIVYTCLDQLETPIELKNFEGCDEIYTSYSPESTKISKFKE